MDERAVVAPRGKRPSPRHFAFASWAAIVGLSFVGAIAIHSVLGLEPAANQFDLPAWETRYFPGKWLYGAGRLFRASRTVEDENAGLARFLSLDREIEDMERRLADAHSRGAPAGELSAALAAKRRERARLENGVEATIEGRVTAIAAREGVKRGLGPLPDMVWPPVDFEFTAPPHSLAISPRDHIELRDSSLLRDNLTIEQVEAIESDRERRDNVSALAFPTGGVAAYPALVAFPTSYRSAVELAAHEWTHNYLAFRPLGVRYFVSQDLRTINETVADLVGSEIAAGVLEKWPLGEPAVGRPENSSQTTSERVDLGGELRKLRGEVDALLAGGKIDEAERLMEERRQFLVAHGYFIRKINQAYFAFTNLYAGRAGSPGATNPIGPKIDELRRRAGSLREFLRIAGDVKSVADLDRALAELAGP